MKARISAVLGIALTLIVVCHSRVRAQPSRPFTQQKATGSRTVWDGVFTQAQANRGEPLYHEHCSDCHGDELEGDDEVTPLAGAGFLANWNGLMLGDLFERIHRTMPMNKPATLSRPVESDILAYILSQNQFPVGATELPHDTPTLMQIRIDAMKPDPSTKTGSADKGK